MKRSFSLTERDIEIMFQPFLRFYRSCVRLLWVFKFFFGFLSSRRSAWNHALHSFHTALGKIDAPFFGVLRKEKREKSGKERHSSQLAVWRRVVNRPVQSTASASLGPAPSGVAYTVSSPPRLSRPPLRLAYAGREAEKPNASVATQIRGRRLHQPVHEGCRACCRRFIPLEMAVAPPAA